MWFAEKKRVEALKKSSVKIKGNDVVASWKILVGLFIIPPVLNLTTALFFFTFSHRYASTFMGRYLASCVFCVILCLYLTFCVQLLNGVKSNSRRCRIRAFVILYRKTIARLRAHRKELKRHVKTVMDKYSTMNEQTLFKRKSFQDKPKMSDWHINTDEVFGALSEIIN